MSQSSGRFSFWEKRYGLDLRSLAVLRMGLAGIIFTDLIIRLGDLSAHYTDDGVLPRTAANEILPGAYWSLHLISGQLWVQGLLFAIAIALTLCLFVGYKTRLATIASWALVLSLHNRNPVLIFAADDVLRAVMFWAMFLPLGARYSIDSALNTASKPWKKRVFGAATLAFMVQQCYVYMFSAFFKTTSSAWWPDGSAVYYALSFDQYVTSFGAWLLNLGALLPLFSFSTLVLEWIGPLFIFMPVRTDLFRNITIVTFILLHLGFGLTLNIGIFPALSITTWLAFIPSSTWDRWRKQYYRKEHDGLRIYYDADCGFCKKVVHLIRTFFVLPDTPLSIAQDDPHIHQAMENNNSWVVTDWQGNYHFKFEAIAYCCSLSPVFKWISPLLYWQPILGAGNRFYGVIANNRKTAGLLTKPLKFREFSVGLSKVNHVVVSVCLLLMTLWNFRSITTHYAFVDSPNPVIRGLRRITNSRTANRINPLMQATRLDQSWSIFSPSPPRDDGWYIVEGELEDGSRVNLLQPGQPISTEKPTLGQRRQIYGDMQWRTYFLNLNRAVGKTLYPYYGRYLCKTWPSQASDGQTLERVSVRFISERTVEPGAEQTVEEQQTLDAACDDFK